MQPRGGKDAHGDRVHGVASAERCASSGSNILVRRDDDCEPAHVLLLLVVAHFDRERSRANYPAHAASARLADGLGKAAEPLGLDEGGVGLEDDVGVSPRTDASREAPRMTRSPPAFDPG